MKKIIFIIFIIFSLGLMSLFIAANDKENSYELELISSINDTTSKPPILFIHGMGHGAWCWKYFFMPYFKAKGHSVYAVSLRGHGNSKGFDDIRWFSVEEYVKDVESIINTLPRKPILIGHSMGGFIIQKGLIKGWEIQAAALISSVPHSGMMNGSLKIAQDFPSAFLMSNLTMSTTRFAENEEVLHRLCFSNHFSEELFDEIKPQMQNESYRSYLDMLLDLHTPKPISTPMLFIAAENDYIVDSEEIKETAKLFNADYKIIKDIAHDTMLDSNWKEVANYINDWLEINSVSTK